MTGCDVSNWVMSPLPAGASLNAATGAFSWAPTAVSTTQTRALIDEGATYTYSDYYIPIPAGSNPDWEAPNLP